MPRNRALRRYVFSGVNQVAGIFLASVAANFLAQTMDAHSTPLVALDARTQPSKTVVQARQFQVEPVTITRSGADVTLKMRVWNCGKEPWVTDIENMPWSIHMTSLVLAQAGIADSVKTALPLIGEPPDGKITIPANGHVDGDIRLDWYFPRLGSTRNFDGTVLLWAYDLASISRRVEPVVVPDDEAYLKSIVPTGGAILLAGPWEVRLRNPCKKGHESTKEGGVRQH